MNSNWGAIVLIISLIGWLGQTLSAFSPKTAVKLGLAQPEADLDSTFYADVRGEAYWDAMITWTLPVAGLLLILDSPSWAYFGLVGGGMYLYISGRGIVVRRLMERRGIRIGKPENLKLYNASLALWGLIALVTIVMAVAALS